MKELVLYLLGRITFASYLVIVMTVGFFGLITLAIFKDIPEDARAFVFSTIGGIGGSVATIITFKFGSSAHGQQTADAILTQEKGKTS